LPYPFVVGESLVAVGESWRPVNTSGWIRIDGLRISEDLGIARRKTKKMNYCNRSGG
jgi:hypothetical protein